MKKRIMSVLLAGLITAGMLAGCQKTATESNGTDTEQAGTEDSSKAKYNYTFVSPLINHEYWMTVDEGIQAEAEATGVSVNTIGETKVDVDAMTKYIDSAIASKVDGIITMALSPSALGPAIDRRKMLEFLSYLLILTHPTVKEKLMWERQTVMQGRKREKR